MKRAVLDTNLMVSSALSGALVLVLEKWIKANFTVVIAINILDEYLSGAEPPEIKVKAGNHRLASAFRVRKNITSLTLRHCERSEAIFYARNRDCFVASLLAMTEVINLQTLSQFSKFVAPEERLHIIEADPKDLEQLPGTREENQS